MRGSANKITKKDVIANRQDASSMRYQPTIPSHRG
nr:MAG TPA: hypothetical protein [Caudoviricetes sp.]